MKTIGKTLEKNNSIIELSNEELLMIIKSLDYYSKHVIKKEIANKYSNLMFLLLGIEKY